MKHATILLAAAALACAMPGQAQVAPKAAIVEIAFASGAYDGWGGFGGADEARTSNRLRDMLASEFNRRPSNKFGLLSRAKADEGRSPKGGEISASDAAGIGRQIGANYILAGKVSRLSYKQKTGLSLGVDASGLASKLTGARVSGGSSGVSVGGVNLNVNKGAAANFEMKKADFTGRLEMTLIDAETGEAVATILEEATTSGVGAMITKSGSDVAYDDDLISKVFDPVVKKIAPRLVSALESRVASNPPGTLFAKAAPAAD